MISDDTEWVIIDTETDGLYYPIHVIDVAAQRMVGMELVGEPFQVFINHEVPIPTEAYAVHGYTQKFLAENGLVPHDAYDRLRGYVGDRFVTSHYLGFDWDRALLPEWTRLKIRPIGKRGFCTWLLSRRVISEMPSHRLDALRERFALRSIRPHSALGDVESVYDLFERILTPRLRKGGVGTFNEVFTFSRMVPLAKCLCLVEGRDWEAERMKYLEAKTRADAVRRLIDRVKSGRIDNIPAIILQHGLILEEPSVEFDNHVFLFTGKMKCGSRSQAQAKVQELGGKIAKSKAVSQEVDYLVLGEDSEKGWTALLYGGKLKGAFCRKLLDSDEKLKLILESDFIAAVSCRLEQKSRDRK